MELSVIIPARNEQKAIGDTLAALQPLLESAAAEVVVVDAGSEDDTSLIAQSFGVTLVSTGAVPPGIARNIGVANSKGRLLAFLDADIIVSQRWIQHVLSMLSDDSRQPMVTGYRYGIKEDANWLEKTWFGAMQKKPASYINSGNLVCDAKVFHSIGGFSETLVTGEDVDFCERARGAGFPIVYDQRLRVTHLRYPDRISDFWIREAWHGSGDGGSIVAILHSKVAIASLVFAAGLLLLLISLFAAMPMIGAGAGGFLVLLLAACSFTAFRPAGWRFALINIPLYAVYLSARFASLLLPKKVIANWKNSRNRAA